MLSILGSLGYQYGSRGGETLGPEPLMLGATLGVDMVVVVVTGGAYGGTNETGIVGGGDDLLCCYLSLGNIAGCSSSSMPHYYSSP